MSAVHAERPAEPMQTDTPAAAITETKISDEAPKASQMPQTGAPPPKRAKQEHSQEALHTLAVRPYLENTVVPLLMQGLQQLVMDRPEDPVEALARFLLEKNPKKKK